MKANELRIGNYVLGETENEVNGEEEFYLCKVLSIDSVGACEYPIMVEGIEKTDIEVYDGFSGVSLTEEWLLKFGFVQTRLRQGTLFYEYNGIRVDNPFDLFFSLGEPLRNNRCVNIKHVHELQNLYFALTGEELTIKE